jgi:hypothetical protein
MRSFLFGKYSYVPTIQKNLLPLSETRRCRKAFFQKVGTWLLNPRASRPRNAVLILTTMKTSKFIRCLLRSALFWDFTQRRLVVCSDFSGNQSFPSSRVKQSHKTAFNIATILYIYIYNRTYCHTFCTYIQTLPTYIHIYMYIQTHNEFGCMKGVIRIFYKKIHTLLLHRGEFQENKGTLKK